MSKQGNKVPDLWTLLLFLVLVFCGWLNIYSVEFNESMPPFFKAFYISPKPRFFMQLIFIFVALITGIVILISDPKFYTLFAYSVYIFIMLLLVAVLIVGVEVHGSRAWFRIGRFRLQPAEFAKFATCLALAKYMASFGFSLKKISHFLKASVLVVLPALLIILENDVGSAIVFCSFISVFYREGFSPLFLIIAFLLGVLFITIIVIGKLIMLFIIITISFIIFYNIQKEKRYAYKALGILFTGLLTSFTLWQIYFPGLPIYYVILLGLIPTLLSYVYLLNIKKNIYDIILIISFLSAIFYTFSTEYIFTKILQPHQQERIHQVLGMTEESYNIKQSKIAIGSGELLGKGYLQGTQTKLKLVPEQETDFIFCTVGEEWGFVGSLFIIGLFLALILRIIFLGERQRSVFSRVYAYGVAGIFFFHFFINIGMTIGLIPVVGIPLPFFSYGGSSLLAFTILLFILLKLDMHRLELLR